MNTPTGFAVPNRLAIEKLLVTCVVALACACLFFLVDARNAQLLASGGRFVRLETLADAYIPLMSPFVFFYYLYYVWVFLAVFALRERAQFYHGAAAFLTVQAAAIATFLFAPSRMIRPPIDGSGLAADLLRFMYEVDPGFNLLPSLHVAHTVLVAMLYRQYRPAWSPVITTGTVLIGLSTVLIKQHYVIDVPLGVMYGVAAFRLTAQVPGLVLAREQNADSAHAA